MFRTMRGARVGAVLTVLVASVFGAGVAHAAEYPPVSGDLSVSTASVSPGGSLDVSGGGCAAGAEVSLAVAGASAGSAIADEVGAFSASVQIPSDASGTVDVTATCTDPVGSPLVLSAQVTVAADGVGTGDGSGLPLTGAGTLPMVLLGLVLLGLGGAFVVAGRRRAQVVRVSSVKR